MSYAATKGETTMGGYTQNVSDSDPDDIEKGNSPYGLWGGAHFLISTIAQGTCWPLAPRNTAPFHTRIICYFAQ